MEQVLIRRRDGIRVALDRSFGSLKPGETLSGRLEKFLNSLSHSRLRIFLTEFNNWIGVDQDEELLARSRKVKLHSRQSMVAWIINHSDPLDLVAFIKSI